MEQKRVYAFWVQDPMWTQKKKGKNTSKKLELNIQGIKPNKKGSHIVQYVKQSYGSFFDLSYQYLSYSQFRLKW